MDLKLLKVSFGKYFPPPRIITDYYQLSEDIERERHGFEALDLDAVQGDYRYQMTPFDMIVFAHTGMGGRHFGILTEFGHVKNIEDAWVAMTDPLDKPHTNIVARNIYDFFNLVYTVRHSDYLDKLATFSDDEEFYSYISDDIYDYAGVRELSEEVAERLAEKLGLKRIPDICRYARKIREEREGKIRFHTEDGTGIIMTLPSHDKSEKLSEPYDFYTDGADHPGTVTRYLNSACYEAKLVFFRDILHFWDICSEANFTIKAIVIKEMRNLGLNDEADRFVSFL